MRLRIVLLSALLASAAFPQTEKLLKGIEYRLVGPFRGGRVLAVTGIPGDPSTFYFGGASSGPSIGGSTQEYSIGATQMVSKDL